MATQLKDFATPVVAVVEPDTTAHVVAQLMRQHHIGAMVVVDAADAVRLILVDEQGRLVGILSMEDLLEPLTRELAALSAGMAGARDREIRQRK